ncbi:DUF421 domain-containing protein [Frateuria defendens]|uniref:DUF421 domain-containing protein n=1 Tax=Frateuria defendens TaxID=2219559 RepID=UPI00066FD987|nr:YetF domain-containing protein [Frateuria defendens]
MATRAAKSSGASRTTAGRQRAIQRDLLVLILVGGTLRTAIVDQDGSLGAAFIGVATILALDKLLGYVAARSARFNRWVEGVPAILARAGKVSPAALRRHNMPAAVFQRALRAEGLHDEREVEEARLEPNGRITVIRHKPMD